MKKISHAAAPLALLLAAALSFSACKKDATPSSNTLTIRGATLQVSQAIYAIVSDNFINLDMDAGPEATQLHGYGGFPKDWIGKPQTITEPTNFFLSYNPMSGPSIDPVLKSGTITVTQVAANKLHVLVDAVETNDQPFKLDCMAYDEDTIDWDTFKYE